MKKKLLLGAALYTTVVQAGPADLQWMVGHWCSMQDGRLIEEQWFDARGDLLLGMSRTVKGARTESFEFLRIEWKDGVASYIAQPQGDPPVAFRLVASGADWARFENAANDFPKRIEYRKTGRGLHAEIAGPGDGGRQTVIPFDYATCK
jgi:hypothetical protein